MSELKSIVVTVCCVVGIVLVIGGGVAYNYGERVRVDTFKYETVHPYRSSGVPLIIWGIALLVAGCVVYLTEMVSINDSSCPNKES